NGHFESGEHVRDHQAMMDEGTADTVLVAPVDAGHDDTVNLGEKFGAAISESVNVVGPARVGGKVIPLCAGSVEDLVVVENAEALDDFFCRAWRLASEAVEMIDVLHDIG